MHRLLHVTCWGVHRLLHVICWGVQHCQGIQNVCVLLWNREQVGRACGGAPGGRGSTWCAFVVVVVVVVVVWVLLVSLVLVLVLRLLSLALLQLILMLVLLLLLLLRLVLVLPAVKDVLISSLACVSSAGSVFRASAAHAASVGSDDASSPRFAYFPSAGGSGAACGTATVVYGASGP